LDLAGLENFTFGPKIIQSRIQTYFYPLKVAIETIFTPYFLESYNVF